MEIVMVYVVYKHVSFFHQIKQEQWIKMTIQMSLGSLIFIIFVNLTVN